MNVNDNFTPAQLQKFADLLTDKGLDFWGFHNVWGSVEKHMPEGYTSMLELCTAYELAETLSMHGELDAYLPEDDDQ